MTDYVVGDPLKELYSNCGLFVLPSHTEGLSLSLLEALSIGARCLVSDIPENTVVTDIYGATFKPEDTDDLARALERELMVISNVPNSVSAVHFWSFLIRYLRM